MIGEWNDAIENDIMALKRDIIDVMMSNGINKFILIAEMCSIFTVATKTITRNGYEENEESGGWVVVLNMSEAAQYDFQRRQLNRFIELINLPDWRIYKPYHLFKKIESTLNNRLVND
jgi:hypothetical protein